MSAVTALLLRREFQLLDKFLLAISITCGLLYLLTVGFQPYPGSVVIKALSVALLAALAFRLLKTFDGLWLTIALVFSCLGDVFLGVGRNDFFLFGLLSFLVAHLIYIGLFTHNFPRPLRLRLEQKIIVAGVLAFSLAMAYWLWDGLGAMKIPALIYLCAITMMCITATLMSLPKRAVVIGALLFLISDSLIAANKFKTAIPWSEYTIWLTYYVGQCLIALGFLREKLRLR
jgi:uncharacterized membrane protein YhhN